jgi:hypothetical protein
MEPFFKDTQPRLGLDQYQNRPSSDAVIHLSLVCCAFALPTRLRLEHVGAHRHRTHQKVPDQSCIFENFQYGFDRLKALGRMA